MASKRRTPKPAPWPRFDDVGAVEALAHAYPPPADPEHQDEAARTYPDAELAGLLARWFTAAADALLSDRLPPDERQRLGAVVRRVMRGPANDTPEERCLAIIRIIRDAARFTPPSIADAPAPDDAPDLTPEEQQMTPQQRFAAVRLGWFALMHPDDGPALDRRALLDAVVRWNTPAVWQPGQAPVKRDQSEATFALVARGIERTSFGRTAEALRSLWRRSGGRS